MFCWCSHQEASAGSCGSGPCFFCLGRLVFGNRNGLFFLASAICAEDTTHWPYTLVSWLSGSLSEVVYIGLLVIWILGLVAFLMLSCSFFMSSGQVRGSLWRRLLLVIFGPGVQFQCPAVPFGPGIDIWRSCRFIGAMMRSLCLLPGGLGCALLHWC